MTPLAQALDILQGEIEMYMGYFLPVISEITNKMTNFQNNNLKFTTPLVESIISGIKKGMVF